MAFDWTRRKLGDFTRRVKRINEIGEELPPLSVTKDRGVMLQSEKFKKRIATDLRKYLVVHKGEFAFDPMSLYYGALGRVEVVERGVVSPDYVAFEPDKSVDQLFLKYLLRSPEMHGKYELLAEGGNQFGKRRRVYWSVFREIEVALPSLSEQCKIASILSAVDDAIGKTQEVIDQLGIVRKSLIDDLLSRGIPRLHEEFQETLLGAVPRAWRVSPLREITTSITVGHVGPTSDFYCNDGVLFLRTGNIQNGTLVLSDTKQITRAFHEQLAKSQLRPGDVLVSRVGKTGSAAVVPEGFPEANCANIIIIRPNAELDPGYLRLALNSPSATRQSTGFSAGSVQAVLNTSAIKNLLVALPSVAEQRQISAAVSVVESRIGKEKLVLEEVRTLKQALLQSVLSGAVRLSASVREDA